MEIKSNDEAKLSDIETKTFPKKKNLYTKCLYILLAFLLIIIKLLIAISIYCYLIKWVISAKPLRIRFAKINGFIKICDGIRYLGYLVLFDHMCYDEMCDRIRYK